MKHIKKLRAKKERDANRNPRAALAKEGRRTTAGCPERN